MLTKKEQHVSPIIEGDQEYVHTTIESWSVTCASLLRFKPDPPLEKPLWTAIRRDPTSHVPQVHCYRARHKSFRKKVRSRLLL